MARTKPIGVRFDPEKLEFLKQREKLQSNQQVIDLLVNRYWWEHKMPIATHKEAPPLSLKLEGIFTPQKVEQKIIKKRTPQEWIEEKREIPDGNTEMYKQWLADLDASDLATKVKTEIKFA